MDDSHSQNNNNSESAANTDNAKTEQYSLLSGDSPRGQKMRRERLSIKEGPRAYNAKYSRFVRSLRLILPLACVIIIAIVFAWGDLGKDNTVSVQVEERPRNQTIGKNELLEPRFESKDTKEQPYTITATRAIQGHGEEGLLVLEQPLADIYLKSNTWIAIKADEGAYREDLQRLVLNGNVHMFHDEGYQFQSSNLHLDLKKNQAWTKTNIDVQGPIGRLEAQGLNAIGNEDRLVFLGPAKMTLYKTIQTP